MGILVTVHNWPMCHMTPYVSDFIPVSLEDMNKHNKVANGHHVTAGGKGQVWIKCATITDILSL